MNSSLNILVVDDSRPDLVLMTAMLTKMGYVVERAKSAEEGLEKFRSQLPDMILMDVIMPGMGGFDAVREMRRILKDDWIPIIFITGLGQEDDILNGIEAGGDDYVLKPIHYKLLSSKIDALHQHLRLFRQMQRQSELLVEYQTRNEEELNDAQEFMGRLLALDKLTDPLVQFHMQAAEVFSGDLIAAGRTPAGHLCVMLADSTGHGLTAALAVMPVLQSFHAMVAKGYSIGAVAAEINRKIMEYLPANRFVAAVLISLDAHNGRVSVWNGGCPPAVLLNPDGMVACQFDSKHLPLGILNPNYFDDEVMHYHYGNNRCHLLLCSDGAVDVADPVSMEIGMAQLVRAACTENMAERLPGIVNMLEEKMAGKKALDDIALILIDCQAEDLAEIAASQQPEAEIIKPDSKCISLEAGLQNSEMSLEWEFSLTLTAPQLKQADIVPLLLHIVNQIELDTPSLAGSLFLVLSELFNNALDHGLLRLDSALKHDPQGMDRYFEERTTRLKQLELGEIKIALTKISTQSGPCLKIAVRDTGDGFDVATLQANALDASTRRHGRGIALVKSLCNQLTYSDHGRESQALICIG